MLRSVVGSVLRTISVVSGSRIAVQHRAFSQILSANCVHANKSPQMLDFSKKPAIGSTEIMSKLLQSPALPLLQHTPVRGVTKFSLNKGKRKSVGAVLKRFKRLDWGAWIRTHCGRHKKIWKKSSARQRRLRQHIFTNAQQSWLLDKMVTNYWRRPKYYIDDPYEPYHKRPEFFATTGKTFKV